MGADEVVAGECYCTLCDSRYLPQALAMHGSLTAHDPGAHLHLLCMDDAAFDTLTALAAPSLTPLRLADIESRYSAELAGVAATRSHGEYCWTLTPWLIRWALELTDAERVTYVDADCFFYSSPQRILERFTASGAHALLTPHAYGPEHRHLEAAGEFCVQFVSVRATERGDEILGRWAGQCAEWCYDRYEDGKFGDQKYLDEWPGRYGTDVYALDDPSLTLAPWNVEHQRAVAPDAPPCMYHFHTFRWLTPHRVQLCFAYQLSPDTYRRLYRPYVAAVAQALDALGTTGYTVEVAQGNPTVGGSISLAIHTLRRERRTARIRYRTPIRGEARRG